MKNLITRTILPLTVTAAMLLMGGARADAFWGHHGRVTTAYSMPSVPVAVGYAPVVAASPVIVASPVVTAAPVIAASPVVTASYAPVVTSYAPTTTYYAPAAPATTTYYAPSAPVTTSYYAPAPVTTSYYSPAPVTMYYAPAVAAPIVTRRPVYVWP
jgi:hypothetical protein